MKKIYIHIKKDTRSGFGSRSAELEERILMLWHFALILGSLKWEKFIEENPERFVQVGIAEANMMLRIAAGMTQLEVKSSMGNFLLTFTGRVYDQIRQSIKFTQTKKIQASTCWINFR
jgi:transketolase